MRDTIVYPCLQEGHEQDTPLPKLKLQDQVIAEEQMLDINKMRCFVEDYKKIRRISRYALR